MGSRELKLFEPVVVEFMLQELGFHVAHIQSCFYHIYVWASARIKNFHLGSAGGSVSADEYVFLCGGQIGLLHWLPISGSSRFSVGWS